MASDADSAVVTWTVEERIGRVLLNRPQQQNAVDHHVRAGLRAATEAMSAPEVRAVVIAGSGANFCAGADINDIAGIRDEAAARSYIHLLRETFRGFGAVAKPTIAAIEGNALGGGFELALWCDLRVVSAEARLGLPEVTLGAVPAAGATQLLPRLAGQSVARQLCLTGEPITGRRAYELGLATECTDVGHAVAAAIDLAGRLASRSVAAMAAVKQALSASWMPLDDALEQEHRIAAALFLGPDHAAGTQAFAEKRQPDFSAPDARPS